MVDKMDFIPRRFLVASNRLPYRVEWRQGKIQTTRGVGGLVTALDPILKSAGGIWLGWSGSHEQLPEKVFPSGDSPGYSLRLVDLTRRDVEDYYLGYSNRSLWPLCHYFQEYCEFHAEHWSAYERVNRKFAEAILREHQEGDLIWIHDYHLMLVPAMIRRELPRALIGFFLHIPFPSAELFMVEPHARELLLGMLGSDLMGFHTDTYTQNFLNAVAVTTRGSCRKDDGIILAADDRTIRAGCFPISIAFEYFERKALDEATARRVKEIRDYYHAEILALGVDRLDYTKGILERLRAIEIMLEHHPELQGKFTFLQISAPSRAKVQAYGEMREKVEQMVGHINGRFGGKGCLPVDYRFEAYSQDELVAFYRASDLALVTPLRDGMNLVAKEYVASRIDESGALVLSRFAGACEELRDAFVVNPYDVESSAEVIYGSINTPEQEKRERMGRMREVVRRHDIYSWLRRFLLALPVGDGVHASQSAICSTASSTHPQ
jgi:alpha,alpha-trehalose-phosphate synthase [UDP-forming]